MVSNAKAEINDEALLFSASAAQKAELIMKDIQRKTGTAAEIDVRTIPSLPSNDPDPRALSVRLFGERKTKGMLVLIVKNPPRVVFAAGDSLLKKLPDTEEIRVQMLQAVTEKQYDKGLLSGLGALGERMKSTFPSGAAVESTAKDGISKLTSLWSGSSKTKKPAEPQEEPGSSTTASIPAKKGFSIPSGFFYIMFGVIAVLLLPRDRVLRLLNKDHLRKSFEIGKARVRALLPGKSR